MNEIFVSLFVIDIRSDKKNYNFYITTKTFMLSEHVSSVFLQYD